MLQKPELHAGLMGYLGPNADFTYLAISEKYCELDDKHLKWEMIKMKLEVLNKKVLLLTVLSLIWLIWDNLRENSLETRLNWWNTIAGLRRGKIGNLPDVNFFRLAALHCKWVNYC